MGLLIPIALWDGLSRAGIFHPVFVPPPLRVAGRALVLPREVAEHYAITLQEIVVAFLFISVIGVVLGILLAQSRTLDAVLGPLIWFVYASPVVAFITFFVVFLGVGPAVPISLGVLSGVVFVIASTRDGVRQIGVDLIKVGRVFGASRAELALKIIVPAAVPMIMAGMRAGAGRMLVGVIVGEFFASGGGLGYLIIKYGYELDMERVYATVIWLVLVSIALNTLFARIERAFVTWRAI